MYMAMHCMEDVRHIRACAEAVTLTLRDGELLARENEMK